MIRNVTLAVSLLALTFAVVPSAGCSSSGGSSGGESSSASGPGSAGMSANTAGSAGALVQPGAGSSSVAGAAGSSSTAGSGGANTSAGSGGSLAAAGASNGGLPSSSGSGNGGQTGSASGSSGSAGAGAGCDTPNLIFKTANKTNYTSYPEPGSEECVKFSGCLYEGLFEACDKKQTQEWVKAHNIVAAFPLQGLELHDLCLKKGDKAIVVTVYDTCGDADCDGCCTQNKGDKDELIDIESFTDQRFGVGDGEIQWADLGPTKTSACAK